MPKVVVAFWNCVMSVDWYELTMAARMKKFKDAVQNANNIGLAKNSEIPHNGIRTIFVAPEYAFSNECVTETDKALLKAVVQTDKAGRDLFVSTITQLGAAYPDMLLVPGTISSAVGGVARNTCAVVHGNKKLSFDKKEELGEVAAGDGLRFGPGEGCGLYTQDGDAGNTFLMHICKDATVEPGSGAPTVDVHIVVGRGVGRWQGVGDKKDFIRPRANKLLIVADGGSYEVYDYRKHIQLASCFRSKIVGCELHYYLADM